MNYEVKTVTIEECKEWLLYKHYARRIPIIVKSFGLFDGVKCIGICTFGNPARAMNNGECVFNSYRVKTLELNRLIVNDNLPKNTLSYFVSSCLKLLIQPCCVVSYADDSNGHHGYIYQATNWVYTGLNQVHDRQIFLNGKEVHPRTATSKSGSIKNFCKEYGATLGGYTKKHRYFYFLGDKRQKRKMLKDLIYDIETYPKGDNKRYDSSFNPNTQVKLF